jgi:RNA polymerase sigma-70 factor (ECF subfamily)
MQQRTATPPPPPPQPLEALARAYLAQGDPTTFRRLYDHCWNPLVRFFTRRGFPPVEAEDLSQNVLLRVYKSMGTFRFESRFETWLFRIAGNEWKNELRRRQTGKRQAEEVPIDTGATGEDVAGDLDLLDLTEGPLETLLADERSALLRQALSKLSPRERQCLILRGQKDLKYREIATALKLSLATVKTHIVHGYRRLRPLLEQHPEVFEAQEPPG